MTMSVNLAPNLERYILSDYLQAKEVERNVPKRASNITLNKAVYLKMKLVMATVSVCTTFLTHF